MGLCSGEGVGEGGDLYSGEGVGGGAYIQEEKNFNLQSVKLTFLSFFFSV